MISIYFLSNSLIIHQEKTKKITTVTMVWICDPNYHKILPTLALNNFLQDLSIIWEAISNTQKCVSSDIQTPWSRLKKLGCTSFFQPTSQCLDIWWNTPSRVWCNISNTRHSVSSHIKHREESWKYDAKRSIFDELRGFWYCDETLWRVFDITSQTNWFWRRN